MQAVFSRPLSSKEEFEKFVKWFSEYHVSLKCQLFPRDFMWYNEKDWLSTREEIISWVNASDEFDLYVNGEGKDERYPMFHIVSPGWMMSKGISIEDLYVPIVEKMMQ